MEVGVFYLSSKTPKNTVGFLTPPTSPPTSVTLKLIVNNKGRITLSIETAATNN